MGVVLRTLGTGTVYSPFTSMGANTDYTSRYIPYTDYLNTVGVAPPLTGAIGDTGSRPIMFTYLQIYSTAGSAGTIDLQIATAADGSGGVNLGSLPITTANNDWNVSDTTTPLQYAAFARNSAAATQTFYYGFQKNDTNTFTFRRQTPASTAYNPAAIYEDGTSVSTGTPNWNTTVIQARIRFATVPSEPTITSTTAGSTAIDLGWSTPTDDGAVNNVIGSSGSYVYHGIYGYRILLSLDGTSWAVYGSGTSGSPSGTHDISFGTAAPNPPTSATVSGLQSNTNYYFRVAALNVVTDRHGGVNVAPAGSRAFANYTSTAAHTGTNSATSGPIRTLLAAPTVSGSYTSTANVNAAYSSNVTWTQAAGGGVIASTLSYSVFSGSLPAGLSLNTSTGAITGTPTTPGVYTFTIRATNLDSLTATTSTQTITVSPLGPKVSPADGAAPTTRSTVKVWNGSAFVDGTMRVYDGTTPYNANGWKYLT